MISVKQAHQLTLAHAPKLALETVPIEHLEDRVLALDLRATRKQPPFDRVAMDGIAVKFSSSSKRRFVIEATQRAGTKPLNLNDPAGAIEVMTGAVLPQGTDTVIPYERCRLQDGVATIHQDFPFKVGMNIHFEGGDYAQGRLLLPKGTRLNAPQVAIVASQGLAQVEVFRSPKVALVSTGDELVSPGKECLPWQIWRSNPFALKAQLNSLGTGDIDFFHANDDLPALFSLLENVLSTHQVVIIAGGVSAGKFDFVDTVLADLGVTIHFHKVAQKPGKPLLLGTGRQEQCVFGLPGNPVSALVCMRRYVIPCLRSALGVDNVSLAAVLKKDMTFKKPLTLFAPVEVECDAGGTLSATPLSSNGSGDFFSLARSHGFCELPAEQHKYEAGQAYPLYLWREGLC